MFFKKKKNVNEYVPDVYYHDLRELSLPFNFADDLMQDILNCRELVNVDNNGVTIYYTIIDYIVMDHDLFVILRPSEKSIDYFYQTLHIDFSNEKVIFCIATPSDNGETDVSMLDENDQRFTKLENYIHQITNESETVNAKPKPPKAKLFDKILNKLNNYANSSSSAPNYDVFDSSIGTYVEIKPYNLNNQAGPIYKDDYGTYWISYDNCKTFTKL